jgi:hypothetical protein
MGAVRVKPYLLGSERDSLIGSFQCCGEISG